MAHENATPRPWSYDSDGCIHGSDDVLVALMIDGSKQGDCPLIVDAVNQFDTLRAERDALREENERLKAGGWQPIETAPKEGSSILVYVPLARRAKQQIQVGNCAAGAAGHEIWVIGNLLGYDVGEPSHWMPLPKGPQS